VIFPESDEGIEDSGDSDREAVVTRTRPKEQQPSVIVAEGAAAARASRQLPGSDDPVECSSDDCDFIVEGAQDELRSSAAAGKVRQGSGCRL